MYFTNTSAICGTFDKGVTELCFVYGGKLWKDSRMIRDTVISLPPVDTRTHRTFQALEEICLEFDLGKPIWLEKNIREFQSHNKTRFTQDSFIESIDFDYLEIQILDEE